MRLPQCRAQGDRHCPDSGRAPRSPGRADARGDARGDAEERGGAWRSAEEGSAQPRPTRPRPAPLALRGGGQSRALRAAGTAPLRSAPPRAAAMAPGSPAARRRAAPSLLAALLGKGRGGLRGPLRVPPESCVPPPPAPRRGPCPAEPRQPEAGVPAPRPAPASRPPRPGMPPAGSNAALRSADGRSGAPGISHLARVTSQPSPCSEVPAPAPALPAPALPSPALLLRALRLHPALPRSCAARPAGTALPACPGPGDGRGEAMHCFSASTPADRSLSYSSFGTMSIRMCLSLARGPTRAAGPLLGA